jgi:foldase protein PrsA
MAVVNGRPIYMAQLHDILIRGQGLEMARQLIVGEIAQQEADRRGLSVTEAEVRAEHGRMLALTFASVPEAEQRDRLLPEMLAQKGWSLVRWDLACRQNALLRKMAEPNVAVTDEVLRAEYSEQFGRKVQVRHIEVEGLDEAEKVLKELRAKADFAALAWKHSKNPSAKNGGLLDPMSRTGPASIAEAIRQVAFSLKEVGEVSEPVKVGYAFHILRLERLIEPTTAPTEEAQAKMREALRERLIRQRQQQVLWELLRDARYEFTDPVLREMAAKAGAQP